MKSSRRHTSNLADVDLRLIKIFQAIVRHRGFAASQAELGLSAPTISNHIASLESRFGVRLCERGRRGFSLTDDGARIHEASLTLFNSIENFSSIVGSVRGELSGSVHFGTVDAMYTNASLQLHRALAHFYTAAPNVMLHIEIASPQDLQQGLLDGRYQLILTPLKDTHSSIDAMYAFDEVQSLYCGRGHALFDLPDREIQQRKLEDYPYAARSYMTDWGGPQQARFQSAAMTSHMESLAMMILSGKYFGYLPTHFASSWIKQKRMRCLLAHEVSYVDKFYLAQLVSEKNRAMLVLLKCLQKQFGWT